MAKRIFTAVVFTLTALVAALPGQADTTIRLDGSPNAANAVIQVKNNMARLTQASQPAYVLYDKTRDVAIYVDTAKRTYTEIDQQTLKGYAGMASAMRDQLQMLPPAQRALIEERMGGMLGLPEGGLPELDELQTLACGNRTIAGFHCRLYVLLKARQPIGDVCLSSAAEAGVSPADFATLMAMMDFLRHAAGTAQELTGGLIESTRLLLSGLPGVPVAARDYQSRQQFMVAGVSGQPLDAGLFIGYRGYRQQNLLEAIPLGR